MFILLNFKIKWFNLLKNQNIDLHSLFEENNYQF